MNISIKQLQLKRLGERMLKFSGVDYTDIPPNGWINAIRSALNMTLEQLGQRVGKSKQSISSIEKREATGSVSLNTLREIAQGMDMQLVYAFIPPGKTLEEYVEQRAEQLAREIVLQANQQMILEDQGVEAQRLKLAVEDLKGEFRRNLDRRLWD